MLIGHKCFLTIVFFVGSFDTNANSLSDFLVDLLEYTSCKSFDELPNETLNESLHESLHEFIDVSSLNSSYMHQMFCMSGAIQSLVNYNNSIASEQLSQIFFTLKSLRQFRWKKRRWSRRE